MEKLFRPVVRFLIRFFPFVIVLTVVLGGLSLPRVIQLFKNINTDLVDLLPENFPSVQNLLEVRDRLQLKRRFVILLESDYPEKTQEALEDLKILLEGRPGVGKVYAKKEGFEFFKNHQMLYLPVTDLHEIRDKIDRKIQHKKLGGFYISFDEEDEEEVNLEELKNKYLGKTGEESFTEYFVSPNGRIYGFYVESAKANPTVKEEKVFQDEVKEMVTAFNPKKYDPSMTLLFSGSSRVKEYRALIRDLKVAGAISGVLIFLPLLIRFRKPINILIVFLPLAVGIPMGLGLASFWIHKLNVTTSFLFAILGGLGVETGIHLFSRYHERRSQGKSIEAALLDLYVSVGPAILTSVSALAVTFLLMIFSDFRGFSEFGLISGIGLYVIFILYFTFFPALLVMFEKLRLFRWGTAQKEHAFHLRLSPGFIRTLLVLFTLITAASIIAIPRLQFEYDTKKIRADSPTDRITKVKQRSIGSKRFSKGLILIKNEAEARAIENALETKKKQNPDSLLDIVQSLYSLVPEDQEGKMPIIHEMIGLLSDDALDLMEEEDRNDLEEFKDVLKKHRPTTLAEVPAETKKFFTGENDTSESFLMVYAKPGIELDDARNAMLFAEDVENIQTPLGTFSATHDGIVFADVIRTLFKDSKKIIIISCLSIFTFVLLSFRNLKKAGLVMFSIFAGLLWVFGVMFLIGIKFNLYNMVMIPAIMGMSIDNSIHIYHRYDELGKGSLGKVLGTTGIAALLASMTNASGFIGLVFCNHGGLRSMGVIVLIGLATSLVTTLVYLPMILDYLENRQISGLQQSSSTATP